AGDDAGNSPYDTFFVLKGPPAFPTPGARFYLRVFMRIVVPMSAGHNTYIDVVQDATQSLMDDTRIGENNQQLIINQIDGDKGYNSNPTYYQDGMKPGVQFGPGKWVCLEALFDPQHTEIDVWVDGAEVPALHHTDWKEDSYDSIRFGFEKYAGPGRELWYDDI